MAFGHIAHFNQHGFFETFFTTTQDKVRFLRMTLAHSCCGDAAWTYSDVERALQSWLRENEVLDHYENRLAAEIEAAEYMALFGVKHVWRCRRFGVAATGLTGLNYISLFFGDEEAQPTGDVSGKDVRLVNECLLQKERR